MTEIVTTTTPFSGTGRRLGESDGGAIQANGKIKMKAKIISQGKGVIKNARFHQLTLKDHLQLIRGRLSNDKQVLIIDTIIIHYVPRVNEYVLENISVNLITLANKNHKRMVSYLFRASDKVLLEINLDWALNIQEGDLKNSLALEYTCGNKTKNVHLGNLTVYMGGYIQSESKSRERGETIGVVGRSEVEIGSYALDVSCAKYYYPSGNFKLIKSPAFDNTTPLMNHLAYNNIVIGAGRVFDIISSLPRRYRQSILNITNDNWRFINPNSDFLEYMRTSMNRVGDVSVCHADVMMFSSEKSICVTDVQV